MLKELVIRAYDFAKIKHHGQTRKFSDLPYFTHPKGVARILETYTKKQEVIAAGLLHDVIEDTDVTFDFLAGMFGNETAGLVLEVSNDPDMCSQYSSKTEYLKDKISRMSSDALLIKLSDRLHNVLYLDSDCSRGGSKAIRFIERYTSETISILSDLYNIVNVDFTESHADVAQRIWAVVGYLQVKYLSPAERRDGMLANLSDRAYL